MNNDVPTPPVISCLLSLKKRVRCLNTLVSRNWWKSVSICCLLIAGLARAEDTVHLASLSDAGAESRMVGTVIDYTGAGLRMRLAGGIERDFPAARVLRIETKRSVDQLAGDRLYDEQQFSEALARFRAALGTKQRAWLRREILAAAVRCYSSLEQPQLAGETFLKIVTDDPRTPHFAVIPLAWYSTEPPARLRRVAEEWLNRKTQPSAVLLGASHLLATNRRPAALAQLNRLTTTDHEQVAWLATVQIWRATAVEADAAEVLSWQTKLEKMPASLRAGPYYVMGMALAHHQKPENAALALLRVPILYPHERNLAARALLDAAEALEKINRPSEAARLYRELSTKYSETRAAAQAAGRLEKP